MAVLTMPYGLPACQSPLPRRLLLLSNNSNINLPLGPNVVKAGWACLARLDSAVRTESQARVNCAKSRAQASRFFVLASFYRLRLRLASRTSLQDRRLGFPTMTPLLAHITQPSSFLAPSTARLECGVIHLITCRPFICPASHRVGFKLNLRNIPWTSEASSTAVDI